MSRQIEAFDGSRQLKQTGKSTGHRACEPRSYHAKPGLSRTAWLCLAQPERLRLPVGVVIVAIACTGVVAYSQSMELLTLDEIVRLSPPERIALIAQLWDSLDADHLPLTGAQEAELERRLSSLDQDRQNGVTWTALKAELEQRCP